LTFLAPIAGTVAGAIAITALVVMHVLRLRRAPMRVSAVWIWEAASRDTQANVPFQRLRPSWLMLWQLLALALLSMALARPSLTSPHTVGGRLVLLIDTSASMGARDPEGSGTRLERAILRARDRLDGLASGHGVGEIAILEASAQLRVVQPFTTSLRSARRALADIEQTDQEGDLSDSISKAISLLRASPSGAERSTGRIVCFSDGVTRATAPRGIELSEGIRLELDEPSAVDADPVNTGVVAIRAERDGSSPDQVSLFAQILSTSRTTLRVPLIIDVNGEPAIARELELPSADENAPALLAISETLRIEGSALISVRVRYEDALRADNIAHCVLGARHAPRVMIVAADGESDPFLEHALAATGAIVVRTTSPGAYESVWANSLDVDAIVFDRASTTIAPPIPTLSFGSTGGLEGISLDAPSSPATTGFTFWKREHPVMSGVSLEQVLVRDPLAIGNLEHLDPSLGVTILARTPSGPGIAIVEDGSRSHVLVATPLESTSWPLDASFIVFLSNVLPVLTPELSPASRSYASTQTVLVSPDPGASRIQLEGPASYSWAVHTSGARVAIGPVPRVGAYELRGSSAERWLAINLESPTESALAPASLEFLQPARESVEQNESDESRREIWHWFLLVGLVLLMLEWFISSTRLRS
jgi:hypothetical protein